MLLEFYALRYSHIHELLLLLFVLVIVLFWTVDDSFFFLFVAIAILMNYYCARFLKMEKTGLYRSAKLNQDYKPPEHVPKEINKFLKFVLLVLKFTF